MCCILFRHTYIFGIKIYYLKSQGISIKSQDSGLWSWGNGATIGEDHRSGLKLLSVYECSNSMGE